MKILYVNNDLVGGGAERLLNDSFAIFNQIYDL